MPEHSCGALSFFPLGSRLDRGNKNHDMDDGQVGQKEKVPHSSSSGRKYGHTTMQTRKQRRHVGRLAPGSPNLHNFLDRNQQQHERHVKKSKLQLRKDIGHFQMASLNGTENKANVS